MSQILFRIVTVLIFFVSIGANAQVLPSAAPAKKLSSKDSMDSKMFSMWGQFHGKEIVCDGLTYLYSNCADEKGLHRQLFCNIDNASNCATCGADESVATTACYNKLIAPQIDTQQTSDQKLNNQKRVTK